jgi:hypothetical protein
VSVARDPGGEAATGDAIRLRIPHARPYHGVARLVVGGLAARLDFSYEHLEDLQLALASILERDGYLVGPDVTVRLSVKADGVGMVIGPVQSRLRSDLELAGEQEFSLRRLLSALVDSAEVAPAEGGDWLVLEKRVSLKHPAPR